MPKGGYRDASFHIRRTAATEPDRIRSGRPVDGCDGLDELVGLG